MVIIGQVQKLNLMRYLVIGLLTSKASLTLDRGIADGNFWHKTRCFWGILRFRETLLAWAWGLTRACRKWWWVIERIGGWVFRERQTFADFCWVYLVVVCPAVKSQVATWFRASDVCDQLVVCLVSFIADVCCFVIEVQSGGAAAVAESFVDVVVVDVSLAVPWTRPTSESLG